MAPNRATVARMYFTSVLDESSDMLWTGGTGRAYAPAGGATLALASSLGPGT